MLTAWKLSGQAFRKTHRSPQKAVFPASVNIIGKAHRSPQSPAETATEGAEADRRKDHARKRVGSYHAVNRKFASSPGEPGRTNFRFRKPQIQNPKSEFQSLKPQVQAFSLCNFTNKFTLGYQKSLGLILLLIMQFAQKGAFMTKNEEIKALKEELARYENREDPYFVEQSKLIRRMPVEIVKCHLKES